MTDYEGLGTALGKLVAEKNAAYGNSFAKTADFFRLLYPDGIRPDQYGPALLAARMFDKLMRIATDPTAFGESPFRDLVGYSLLGVAQSEALRAAGNTADSDNDCGCGLTEDDDEGAWEGIPPACTCPAPGCEFPGEPVCYCPRGKADATFYCPRHGLVEP